MAKRARLAAARAQPLPTSTTSLPYVAPHESFPILSRSFASFRCVSHARNVRPPPPQRSFCQSGPFADSEFADAAALKATLPLAGCSRRGPEVRHGTPSYVALRVRCEAAPHRCPKELMRASTFEPVRFFGCHVFFLVQRSFYCTSIPLDAGARCCPSGKHFPPPPQEPPSFRCPSQTTSFHLLTTMASRITVHTLRTLLSELYLSTAGFKAALVERCRANGVALRAPSNRPAPGGAAAAAMAPALQGCALPL